MQLAIGVYQLDLMCSRNYSKIHIRVQCRGYVSIFPKLQNKILPFNSVSRYSSTTETNNNEQKNATRLSCKNEINRYQLDLCAVGIIVKSMLGFHLEGVLIFFLHCKTRYVIWMIASVT